MTTKGCFVHKHGIGTLLLALAAGAQLIEHERTYTREYLQLEPDNTATECTQNPATNEKTGQQPPYIVFTRNDDIGFRRIGYNCRIAPGITTPTYWGTQTQGFDHAIQPMPIRGVGLTSITHRNPRYETYKKRFNTLLETYERSRR